MCRTYNYIIFLTIIIAVPYICGQSRKNNEIPVDELTSKESLEDVDDFVEEKVEKIIDGMKKNNDENEEDESEHTDFGQMLLNEVYTHSVDAYLDENWQECIEGFEHVIEGYRKYKNAVIQCRTKCREDGLEFIPIFMENIEDLHFYEKKVRETLCLLRCNQDYRDVAGAKSLRRLPRETEQKIIDLKPYEYLHICYYKKNQSQRAANAMFTYLVLHPKHKMSVDNLQYYLTLPGVKESEVLNLEITPFAKDYIDGIKAYEEEFYEEAIENFENSLRSYIKAEDDCRIYCEGPFDQGWHPEFTSSIANHFAYCLKCKRSCSQYLNNLNGDYQRDLLSSHYNYLQFAYYKLGDIKRACEAVESYLQFFPADETMINNKIFYSRLPKVEEHQSYFTPRKEAVSYVKRQEYELRILKYISEEFAAIDAKLSAEKKLENSKSNDLEEDDRKLVNHPPPGYSPSFRLINTEAKLEEKYISRRESQIEKMMNRTKIIAGENELGGKMRYLAEGLLMEPECQSLIKLAQVAAVEGDGYDDNKSPHSKYEIFEGLTVGRVALMVYFGLLEPEILDLFLHATETARAHVQESFKLNQELYFTYTHLVCRSALPDSLVDENMFSHDIHADNCLAIEENNCLRESPAYTWRDYSAIVYLNEDFEGGEFIFVGDPKARKVQSTIKPKCGRIVGFSADGGNLHGVRSIRKGRRCALALWFTFDKREIEIERRLAQLILDRVRLKGPFRAAKNFQIPLNYDKLLLSRFKEDETLKILIKVS